MNFQKNQVLLGSGFENFPDRVLGFISKFSGFRDPETGSRPSLVIMAIFLVSDSKIYNNSINICHIIEEGCKFLFRYRI